MLVIVKESRIQANIPYETSIHPVVLEQASKHWSKVATLAYARSPP
jgi:hypothetical protein